jgi:hypothetical protein
MGWRRSLASVSIWGWGTNGASIGVRRIAREIGEIARCKITRHLVLLLSLAWAGQGKAAFEGLVVDVGELSARFFEKKLALDGVQGGKDVDEENDEPQEKKGSVLMKQDVAIRNEEIKLAEKPKACGQENGNRGE